MSILDAKNGPEGVFVMLMCWDSWVIHAGRAVESVAFFQHQVKRNR